MTESSNYKNISVGLDYLESLLKGIESDNKNCENLNVILNSQIAGVVQEKINRNIETIDLRDIEKKDLLNRFDELKDYFADIQVGFEINCKCRKTTKKERDEIYERHEEIVLKREGQEYLEKAYETALLQLTEKEIRERGR